MRISSATRSVIQVASSLALLLGGLAALGQDLSSNYVWKPVRIGAGGWMRGMAVSPSDPTRRYARGDVDNVYRWDDAAQVWRPTKISAALPANIASAPTSAGGGAIAIDPQNPDHVLVVYTFNRSADLQAQNPTPGLDVFVSTDGAKTFQQGNLSLHGDLSLETSGERLAVDPNNGQVAYLGAPGAGGVNEGLYRSVDGGVTWAPVAGFPANTSTVRYEAQLPRIDASSGTLPVNGVTSSKVVYITYLTHDETNNDAVTGGGVLKSTDGGLTFADVSPENKPLYFATIDAAGNLFVSDGGSSLLKYSKATGQWTSSVTPHGAGAGIAVDAQNVNRVFVTSGGGTLARSLDGGRSWTDLGGNLTFSTTQTIQWLRPSPIRPQNHYVSISGLYLAPDGKLYAPAANDGVIATTPNDNSDSAGTPPIWLSVSEGIEEMVAEVAVIPPGGQPVLTVEDEQLFTISNPDTFTAQHYTVSTWNGNNGLANATDIAYAPNQPKYLAFLANNITAGNPLAQTSEYSGYSADGGQSWNLFPSIASGTHPCILYGGSVAVSARQPGHENDPAGSDNLVWIPSNFNNFGLFGHGPAPFYSKDGGATWSQTRSFDGAPGAKSVPNPCSNGDASYTYMDFQWGPWIFALAQHLLVADPVTPGTFYVHLDAGGVWKSTDGGVTWAQLPGTNAPVLPQHGQMFAVPGSSGDLWAVDGHEGSTTHGLFHTTDGGNSFTQNTNFDYAWALALGRAPSGGNYPTIYVYGRHKGDPNWGIFQSVDAGYSFQRISYYPTDLVDVPQTLAASWDTFGTVYVGFGGNSYVYGTFSAPSTAPGAPSLSAVAGDKQITLTWQTNSQGGAAVAFNLYRGKVAGGEAATPIASGLTGNSYTDTGLTDGTKYFYTLVATNAIGSSPASNEVSATPAIQKPAAPARPTAIAGVGQVTLSWSPVTGATGYNVFRGTASGAEGTTAIAATKATVTSYVDKGAANGKTYFYVIRAVNSAGAGAPSAEVSATPQAVTGSVAQIAYASTPPALDGSVSPIWSTTATYPLANLTGTIPGGQSNSATWQGLWDRDNLYVLVNVLDSTVVPNNDSVEVYIDGNNGKAASYTPVDLQYLFGFGSNVIQQYSGGTQGNRVGGVTYAQTAITGGYRIIATIPWSTVGVTATAGNYTGIDVAINNFFVAGTRSNKLFWNSTTDQDYANPSLFGTAELLPGAALAQVATPSITPASGTYLTAQTVTITDSTAGAAIYYTTDGTQPAANHGKHYVNPFNVTATTQVKAVAVLKGDQVSQVATSVITFPPQTAAPSILPGSGSYNSDLNVMLYSSTPGATIRYTTDGTAPSETNGTVYSGPVILTATKQAQTVTLNAIAYLAGNRDSTVSKAVFHIKLSNTKTQVALPVFSPASGTFTGTQQVTISTATPGASIRYTTDGSTPSSTAGTLYTGAIPVSASETLQAIAFLTGDVSSSIANASYVIQQPVAAAAPSFSVPPGQYAQAQSVLLATTSAGAQIRYTTDGTQPTATTGTLYNGSPIAVNSSLTINAIAFGTGYAPSSVSTAQYKIGFAGLYYIVNRGIGSTYALNDYSFGGGNVTAIIYQYTKGQSNNEFNLVPNADGSFVIQEQYTSAVLDNLSSNTSGASAWWEAAATPVPANQSWQIVQTDPGFVKIVNASSGQALDAALNTSSSQTQLGNGSLVVQDNYTGDLTQQWELLPAP